MDLKARFNLRLFCLMILFFSAFLGSCSNQFVYSGLNPDLGDPGLFIKNPSSGYEIFRSLSDWYDSIPQVFWQSSKGILPLCSAVLIPNHVILSAGHCFLNIPHSEIELRFRNLDFFTRDSQELIFKTRRIVIHPYFIDPSQVHRRGMWDLALVFINPKIWTGSFVHLRPIKIAVTSEWFDPNQNWFALGWGNQGNHDALARRMNQDGFLIKMALPRCLRLILNEGLEVVLDSLDRAFCSGDPGGHHPYAKAFKYFRSRSS